MTTLNESYVNSLKINRLTKTQLEQATSLSPNQLYLEDPEFAGGKLLETTSDGDIVESSKTIPTVNNPTITITQGGVSKGSFTLNQSTGDTIALDAGGGSPLPSQTGNAGKFLTTDGTDASWGVPNTFKLFHHDWFDYQLNDMAWLRADTFSWQDGTVYTEAYNHLVADYNGGTSQTETVGSYTITYVLATDGHKITTDETNVANIYNESGVSWYYILDTANQRFKLPRELPITDKSKGNGNPISFVNVKDTGVVIPSGEYYLQEDSGDARVNSGTTNNLRTMGLNSNSTKSGIISHRANENGQQYLYFYVGQFSQSATEQTAGLNSSLFNGKADIDMGNVPSNIGSTAKSYFAGIGMPSNDYVDLSVSNWNTYQQAPANGYVNVCKDGLQNLGIAVSASTSDDDTIFNICIVDSSYTGYNKGFLVPVQKGQYYKVYGNSSGTFYYFRFIYAQGEV